VATFYIGAFWDEFMRKNCQPTAGQWRAMPSPVFEEVGTAGAPVSSYFCIVNKGDNVYRGLLEQMWKDFHFDTESRNEWVKSMENQNAPYSNPISLNMLEDEFWKEPSEFYGGMSFREVESQCLENGSKNLIVTPQDAEADEIISAELETYVAGNQTMEEAIANMDKNLKAKIGQADIIG
ncbi:MAG: carbohydrate ABC transporter substrate-binding protein, partial [Eubacteriales bacterium]|nr:carbohydrate ABC transporter substrate-binding protein [Eubacteriales bacterium]